MHFAGSIPSHPHLSLLLLNSFFSFAFSDGRVYESGWAFGRLSGQGTITWPLGIKFEGFFEADEMLSGTFTMPDGSSSQVN